MSWLKNTINSGAKLLSKAPGVGGIAGKGLDLLVKDGGGVASPPPNLPSTQQVLAQLQALTYAERTELQAAAARANNNDQALAAALLQDPDRLLMAAYGGSDWKHTGTYGPAFQATFDRLITSRIPGRATATGGWLENQTAPVQLLADSTYQTATGGTQPSSSNMILWVAVIGTLVLFLTMRK